MQAPHGGLEAHAWSGLRKPCVRSIGTCSSATAPAQPSCTGGAPTLRHCWRLPLQQARVQCTTTGGERIRRSMTVLLCQGMHVILGFQACPYIARRQV